MRSANFSTFPGLKQTLGDMKVSFRSDSLRHKVLPLADIAEACFGVSWHQKVRR